MEPVISVFMATYNHAPFIEEAVEGVVMQETEYPLELIICDDFSTDGTREKVEALAEKYPQIVLSLQPHNSRGIRNMMEGLSKIRGRYVAMCEGDDYWTSPHKLQKQVSFLEANPDFTVSTHRVEMIYQDKPVDKILPKYIYKDCKADEERVRQGIFFADEIVDNYYMHTSSMVFRWKYRERLPDSFRMRMLLDHFLFLIHAAEGKIKYFDEPMSAWRRHAASYSYAQLHDKGLFFQKEGGDWLKCYREIDEYFHRRFHLQIRERMLLALRAMTDYCMASGQEEEIRALYMNNWDIIQKPVLENGTIYETVRELMPQEREFSPPWSQLKSKARHKVAITPDMNIDFTPEIEGSVWDAWTGGRQWASFAGFRSAVAAYCFYHGVNTLWIPSVYSRKFDRVFHELQIYCKLYPITEDFEINSEFLKLVGSGEAVLTPNWFGRPVNADFCAAISERSDIYWIDDRSWRLDPVNPSPAACIYSAANLVGAPDGAILAGADADGMRAGMSVSVAESASRTEFVSQLPAGAASNFTISLLKRLPIAPLIDRRRRNWRKLYQNFAEIALIHQVEADFVPSSFPIQLPAGLLVSAFVGELAKKGVSVSRLWPVDLASRDCHAKDIEKRIVLLPCGHHGDAQMEWLISCVCEILGNRNNSLNASQRSEQ